MLVQRRIDRSKNSKYTHVVTKVYFQLSFIEVLLNSLINIVNRSNSAAIETEESEMSADSMRDGANSMSPPIVNDRIVPCSSGADQQRHLSTDSTRDSGIDSDDPQKSSLATYLPSNLLYIHFYSWPKINIFILCFSK